MISLVPETELRSVTFSQRDDRNFADKSDLIEQAVSEIFSFGLFYIGGWSVDGSVGLIRRLRAARRPV